MNRLSVDEGLLYSVGENVVIHVDEYDKINEDILIGSEPSDSDIELRDEPTNEASEGGVSRHFATQADIFACCRALRNGVGHQLQDGRVQRVIQMRNLLIRAVNRQGVLNQIVGAY